MYFKLNKKIRPKSLAASLNSDFHGIEISAARDEIACKKYVTKLETRADGPWYFPRIYDGSDVKIIDDDPYPWQQQIKQMVKQKPLPRQIVWIVDFIGNTGKSTLLKWFVFNQIGHTLGLEAPRDIALARKTNRNKDCVLFNFTRSIPPTYDIKNLYYMIENIKDGVVFSSKYESNDFTTDVPHIIIFSNILPQPNLLSFDRWKVFRINSNKELKQMSLQQINEVIEDNWNYCRETYKDFAPKDSDIIKDKDKANWFKKYSPYANLWSIKTHQYSVSQHLLDKWDRNNNQPKPSWLAPTFI